MKPTQLKDFQSSEQQQNSLWAKQPRQISTSRIHHGFSTFFFSFEFILIFVQRKKVEQKKNFLGGFVKVIREFEIKFIYEKKWKKKLKKKLFRKCFDAISG